MSDKVCLLVVVVAAREGLESGAGKDGEKAGLAAMDSHIHLQVRLFFTLVVVAGLSDYVAGLHQEVVGRRLQGVAVKAAQIHTLFWLKIMVDTAPSFLGGRVRKVMHDCRCDLSWRSYGYT